MQILVFSRFPKLGITEADSEGRKENWGTKQARLRDTVIVLSWLEIAGQETVKVISSKTV